MKNTKQLFYQFHAPLPHHYHSFSLVADPKVKAIRTIRYVASLAWIMILLQNCHPEHKLNIYPLEVTPTTAMPRVADQAAGPVVSLSSHAAVDLAPLPDSVSSLISAQSSQQELVRAAHATALGFSLTSDQAPFGPLSASTGERVTFKQEGDRWYAETSLGVLPVRSQETVDTYLRWLGSQDLCVSRSRVHIMQNPHGQGRCIYLGKAGLLGGSPTTQGEEWRPGSTNEEENDIASVKVQALLSKKLADPDHALHDQESIALLEHCFELGEQNAEQIRGKDALMVMGNIGAGKSTFLNYLMGCTLRLEAPEAMGLEGLEDIVVVSPTSALSEVMPIGHTQIPKTFIPRIEVDRVNTKLAYCDCPGFLDNRVAEINIANAVNIRRVLQYAQGVKVVILINYYSLLADRDKALRDTLSICTQLFGNIQNLVAHQESLLLCVTRQPSGMHLDKIRSFLTKNQPEIFQKLSERLFIYDPLDRGSGPDCWDRATCREELIRLKSIPEEESGKLFHMVLTAGDEEKLLRLVEYQRGRLQELFHQRHYAAAAKCWRFMDRFRVIDHVIVDLMLQGSFLSLQRMLSGRIVRFRENSVYYRFAEAEAQLRDLDLIASQFSKEDLLRLELDTAELTHHFSYFKKKQYDEEKMLGLMQQLTDQVVSIAAQQRSMEEQLTAQQWDFFEEEALRLRTEMISRCKAYSDQIAKIYQEYDARKRKQEEEASLQSTLSKEERMKQEAKQTHLRRDYEQRLLEVEKESRLVREEYERLLQSQQEAQLHSKAKLQEKLKKFEQAQARAIAKLPAMAFGAQEWKQYMGVAVGWEPPLPPDIDAILDADCPFLLEGESTPQKVRDNHVLVLIPACVNGEPFTLDELDVLIKAKVFPQNEYAYRYYTDTVRKGVGSNSLSPAPYWILLTRRVLEGSLNQCLSAHEKMIEEYDGYSIPHALEAATAILTHYVRSGQRLYGIDTQSRYTRCRETVDSNHSVNHSVFVGAFDPRGLHTGLCSVLGFGTHIGVAACRKLEERLLKVGGKKYSVREEYERLLQSQWEAQLHKEAELQMQLKALVLKPAQATTKLPAMAFGASAWKQYMGVAVGEEPPLPLDIDKILNADCPFLLEGESTPQKVRDNHVLVLIPACVNGEPFTLDKLGVLIKAKVFPQNEYGYRYYSDAVRKEVGSKLLVQIPYWILLTRRVLEGSLNPRLSVHKAMIKEHDGYSMPHALEAATAMLTHYVRSGQRLYGNNLGGTHAAGKQWVVMITQYLLGSLLPRGSLLVTTALAATMTVSRVVGSCRYGGSLVMRLGVGPICCVSNIAVSWTISS